VQGICDRYDCISQWVVAIGVSKAKSGQLQVLFFLDNPMFRYKFMSTARTMTGIGNFGRVSCLETMFDEKSGILRGNYKFFRLLAINMKD
jgi:hypothetical protein